jgi:hypothetical protein
VAQEDHIPLALHLVLVELAAQVVEETAHISQEVNLVLLLVEETLVAVAVAVAEQLRPRGLTRYELALVAVQELL